VNKFQPIFDKQRHYFNTDATKSYDPTAACRNERRLIGLRKMLLTWKRKVYGVGATIHSRLRQFVAASKIVHFPQFAHRGRGF
jgi:hypothetical protein